MEKDCEDAAAVSPPPASPFPIADVALHLANTTNQVLQGRLQVTADVRVLAGVHICSSRGGPGCKTDHTTTYSRGHYSTATAPVVPRRQVLELQSRLDDKEVQLAAMGRQLQAAGLQPVDAQQLPLVVRASLADISNVGSRTPRHASPKKDSMQVTLDASAVPSPPQQHHRCQGRTPLHCHAKLHVQLVCTYRCQLGDYHLVIVTSPVCALQACQKDLAAERAECERMSGCMSALAADLQV